MPKSTTPLHAAVAENDLALVSKLSKKQRFVDAKDADGQTPLHWAAKRGLLDAMKILIRSGARIDARDNLGQTPLYFATASETNAGEMIMALRGGGADPFARTSSGGSPYDLAQLWDDEVASYYSDLPKPPEDGHSPQLVPNVPCYATKRLVEQKMRIGAMDRMEDDGAWYFSLGTETQAEVDDPSTTAIYSLQTLAALDPSVIPYLEAPPGTSLIRQADGRFRPE